MRYSTKWPTYAKQWDSMRIKPDRKVEFDEYARFAIANKTQYLAISNKTGVEWYHIAVIHRRESNANFSTYLGNGQPLSRRTTLVPKFRGPFLGPNGFLNGAIDALRIDGLTSVIDWRLEKILYYSEIFNGVGYDLNGRPSPYIWGGTNIQVIGKYVSDHNWNPRVWDKQPGCAPIIQAIAKLDLSVNLIRET